MIEVDGLEFEKMACGECGVVFYVPLNFYKERRERKGLGWHCPNGHGRQFLETETEKLAKQLAAKEQELQRMKTTNAVLKEDVERCDGEIVKLRKLVKRFKAQKKVSV